MHKSPYQATLELRVPPVILAMLIAVLMWGLSLVSQPIELPFFVRTFTAVVFVVVGAGTSIAGVVSFRRARTTVNPINPNLTSALVNTGIYGVTRNPMYLGFVLVLIGWSVFLSNAIALICAFAFVPYMNRFQITPEERALSAMFGAEFSAYKTKARRWL